MCMSVGSLRCWLSGLLLVCLCWLCVCRLSDSVCMYGFYIYICIHVCVHVFLFIYVAKMGPRAPQQFPEAPKTASKIDLGGSVSVALGVHLGFACLLWCWCVLCWLVGLLVPWFVGSLLAGFVVCWLCLSLA